MPPKKPTAEFVKLDAEGAKELVGWRPAENGEKGYKYLDEKSEKREFVLVKNKTNRPFNLRQCLLYRDQLLKGEWCGQWNSPATTGNGESMTIDSKGNVVSAAHRSAAIVLAEIERKRLLNLGPDGKERLEEWGCKGPIAIQALIVKGVDPLAADTTDLGRERKLRDILFRRDEFGEYKEDQEDLSEAAKIRLTSELAEAISLVHVRLLGGQVAGSKKLPHGIALRFLEEQHSLLHDAVWHCYVENGKGAEGNKISRYYGLGKMAGMMYLAAFSKSDRKKLEEGTSDTTKKPKLWSQAEKFVTLFANEVWGDDGIEPIKALHKIWEDNRAAKENKLSRDANCVLFTRAFLSWTGEENKWKTVQGLKSKLYSKEDGVEVLNLERFGGFDLDKEVLIENGWVEEEEEVVRLSSGDWKKGDTAWVDQPDVEPWFGEIVEFSPDGKAAAVFCEAEWDDQEDRSTATFQTEKSWLCIEKPEREPEPEEEEEVEEE